jgi:hypothetical protein
MFRRAHVPSRLSSRCGRPRRHGRGFVVGVFVKAGSSCDIERLVGGSVISGMLIAEEATGCLYPERHPFHELAMDVLVPTHKVGLRQSLYAAQEAFHCAVPIQLFVARRGHVPLM